MSENTTEHRSPTCSSNIRVGDRRQSGHPTYRSAYDDGAPEGRVPPNEVEPEELTLT